MLVEVMLGMFREAGFSATDALHALQAVFTHVIGHCLVGLTAPPDTAATIPPGGAVVSPHLPHLQSVVPELDQHDDEAAFLFGLDVVLRGLDAKLSQGVAELIDQVAT